MGARPDNGVPVALDKANQAFGELMEKLRWAKDAKLTGTVSVGVNFKQGGVIDFEVNIKERK
jgi:hypothetical protein